jgi:hypothetical protein
LESIAPGGKIFKGGGPVSIPFPESAAAPVRPPFGRTALRPTPQSGILAFIEGGAAFFKKKPQRYLFSVSSVVNILHFSLDKK